MATGSFPVVKSGRGMTLTPHPLLVPWSWQSRAIPLFPYGPYGLYRASVELYPYSPYGPYGLYRASVELYPYSPYGPYGLYRASVELYLYSPCGPYGLYRTSVPVQGCTLPSPLIFETCNDDGVISLRIKLYCKEILGNNHHYTNLKFVFFKKGKQKINTALFMFFANLLRNFSEPWRLTSSFIISSFFHDNALLYNTAYEALIAFMFRVSVTFLVIHLKLRHNCTKTNGKRPLYLKSLVIKCHLKANCAKYKAKFTSIPWQLHCFLNLTALGCMNRQYNCSVEDKRRKEEYRKDATRE
jgi:hypothetical protein